MKIALISHEYPPFSGGGIGTYATVMSAALAHAGHEVHVLTNRFGFGSSDPKHQLEYHREGNLHVHRIPALTDRWEPAAPHDAPHDLDGQLSGHWSPYLYYAEQVARRLAVIHREQRLDVAEFPECAAEGYGVIRRQRLGLEFGDLATSVTLHSPIYEIYQYNLYSRHNRGFARRTMMEEYTIRHADRLNSPSRLLAEIVRQRLDLAADVQPCDVLALPMDFSSLPAQLPPVRSAGPPTLFFVGRLEPRKGVRYLVDAAVRVMARRRDLRVVLVGKDCDSGEAPGSMVAFLRGRIPEELRANFEFPGPRPRAELFERYRAATACVFAAPWDNFPLTCVEAMACGGCVIASDYTGMAEMIEHERSGLLFRSQDVAALAGAIERVLAEPALAARIRAEAPARIRAVCDPDAAVANRIAHYERAIAARRTRAGRPPVRRATRSERVALFIPNHTDAAAITSTVESARAAAEHDGLTADISVVGTAEFHNLNQAPAGVTIANSGQSGEASALRLWLDRITADPPDYLLTLWPGETLAPAYFATTRAALREHPAAAWATTWALPMRATAGWPYAGFDFSAPLELLDYHPVPIALLRHSAFRETGGWRLELPLGWREWDLFLAFENAGQSGLVVPYWLARYCPRVEYTLSPPPHDEMLAVMLDWIVSRSPALFERYGALLWQYRWLNSVTTVPREAAGAAERGAQWDDWWSLTKVVLKTRYPGAAGVYRRFVKRR